MFNIMNNEQILSELNVMLEGSGSMDSVRKHAKKIMRKGCSESYDGSMLAIYTNDGVVIISPYGIEAFNKQV